ncbi:hypothetical protein EIP86_007501 [Pleurotus ostreatoroseus]|nr:hypothetical protein EIP86_007501 [Pleurotus ostreatoroseus]
MIDFGTLQDIYTIGKNIYGIIQSIKDAPEAIRELGTQILLVEHLFEALKDELEGREDAGLFDWSTAPYMRILERARELTEEAEKFLEKATKTKDGNKKVHMVKWLVYAESDAKTLAEKFHKFHASLSALQGAVHLRLSHDVSHNYWHGQQTTSGILQTVVQTQAESIHISQQIRADVRRSQTEHLAVLESSMAQQMAVQSENQQTIQDTYRLLYALSKTLLPAATKDRIHGVNQTFSKLDEKPSTSIIPLPSSYSDFHQRGFSF